MECWMDEACAASSPFHHSNAPLLHSSRGRHAFWSSANATAHVLANSAIAYSQPVGAILDRTGALTVIGFGLLGNAQQNGTHCHRHHQAGPTVTDEGQR